MAERIGIYAASRISARLPGLIFREQRGGDTGLNAHLEITDEYPKMGKILGLQVRSDEGGRLERTARGYVCRGEMAHMAYWLQHSLPVLVMIHERQTDRILWQLAGAETIEIDGVSWELVVPHDHVYGPEAVSAIAEIPCYSPYLARLALDLPWMRLIESGRSVVLEMDEWVNQPSARGSLRLCVRAEGGEGDSVYEWGFQTDPDMPHVFRLPSLFPWGRLGLDEAFYQEKGLTLPEEAPLSPWQVDAGEIARFRLRLSLNELGNAFLVGERFFRRGEFPNPPSMASLGVEYENGIKFRLHKGY